MSGASEPSDRLATVEETLAAVLALVAPVPPGAVPLAEAVGQVLAADVTAPFDLPPFDNAAMDGYAVRAADLVDASAGHPVRLVEAGVSHAGGAPPSPLGAGEACAIATGAPAPAGADAVVRVEDVRVEPGAVLVQAPVPSGTNLRRRGEDVPAGAVLLAAGSEIGPGQVAAAAASGASALPVRRPRVAILPTGDEVVAGGAARERAHVYDAVGPALQVLVAETGGRPDLRQPVGDELAAIREALRAAAATADAVLTVGGVSAGPRDRLGIAAAQLGEVRLCRVALRPAKPFAFGRVPAVPLFGLPGNPAAALAAFEVFVRPALLAMRGLPAEPRPAVPAELAGPFSQRPGRLHLVRAVAWREGDRRLVRPAGPQGSGRLGVLARANAWMVVPPEVERLEAGSRVEVRAMWGLDPFASRSAVEPPLPPAASRA